MYFEGITVLHIELEETSGQRESRKSAGTARDPRKWQEVCKGMLTVSGLSVG